MLASVENAREGFEEASDHLPRTPRFSALTLGPVRELSSADLEPGQLGWERTISTLAGGAARPSPPLSGSIELRLGRRLARGSAADRPDGAATIIERLPGEPPAELRAHYTSPGERLRWKSLLRALRAELESDDAT